MSDSDNISLKTFERREEHRMMEVELERVNSQVCSLWQDKKLRRVAEDDLDHALSILIKIGYCNVTIYLL